MRENIRCLWFVPLALLLIFGLLLPIGQAFYWSLLHWNTTTDQLSGQLSFAAYGSFLDSDRGGRILRCLFLALCATVLTAFIWIPLCCSLRVIRSTWLLGALEISLLAPMFFSQALRLHSLKLLLTREGVIARALSVLGVSDGAIKDLLFSDQSIVIGLVFSYSGLFVLPLIQSLRAVPLSILFSIEDVGVGPVRAFWMIARQSRPGLFVGVALMSVVSWFSSLEYDVLGRSRSSVTALLDGLVSVKMYPEAYALSLGTLATTVLVLAALVLWGKPETLIAPHDREGEP